jgi:hypothetical protein
MLRAIFGRFISGMETAWDYDASYMREILDASPWTFLKFGMVTAVVPRRDARRRPWRPPAWSGP